MEGLDLVERRKRLSERQQKLLEERIKGNGGSPLPALQRQGRTRYLASHAQERLWFLDQLGLVGSAYNMPFVVGLKGELDVPALERSLAEVVRRHEALRTHFEIDDGQVVQVIDAPGSFVLDQADASGLAEDSRETEVRRRVDEMVSRRFDLSQGPLFRASLQRLSEREHVVVLVMHHIVSDGWSIGVLMREVTALYAAFSQSVSSPLPELPIQYADYTAWQIGRAHV